jgi:hypothetical protein
MQQGGITERVLKVIGWFSPAMRDVMRDPLRNWFR